MRKHSPTFEELVNANKVQLMTDPDALSEIEKRVEERKAKEFAKLQEAEKMKAASN